MMRRSEAILRLEQLVDTIAMVVTPLKERLNQLCLCHWQSHQVVVRKGEVNLQVGWLCPAYRDRSLSGVTAGQFVCNKNLEAPGKKFRKTIPDYENIFWS